MPRPTLAPDDFEAQVSTYRKELHAYCYRMLGSLHDAEDALQETLLGAWRGLADFEGRSALRSWLYTIATHACVKLIAQRPKRLLPYAHKLPASGVEIEPVVEGMPWFEPYPHDAAARYELLESVELAFVVALQNLPATQRAVLVLREVLGFDAAEVAGMLNTSVASINSALQRARHSLSQQVPAKSQQAERRDLGDTNERALVAAYVAAWGAADVSALVALLTDDVRFTMPPIPTWFQGRDAVARFFAERVFATPWRLVPQFASGQLAFACYQGPLFRLGALNVVTLRGGAICELTGFLDPAVYAHFSLPDR